MLPLNQKQLIQYKWMRFGHLFISAFCIPLALLYSHNKGTDLMQGYGLPGTLCSMAFLLFFRQFLFPPDFRGALSTTLGLIINFFVVFFLTTEGWLFSCFYIFYSLLCVQALVLIGFSVVVMLNKQVNFPNVLDRRYLPKSNLLAGMIILLAGIPIYIAPYSFFEPFYTTINNAPDDQSFWIWLSFFIEIGQQVFVIGKIMLAKGYMKEIHLQQAKQMQQWDWAINLMFLIGFFALVVVMFL